MKMRPEIVRWRCAHCFRWSSEENVCCWWCGRDIVHIQAKRKPKEES